MHQPTDQVVEFVLLACMHAFLSSSNCIGYFSFFNQNLVSARAYDFCMALLLCNVVGCGLLMYGYVKPYSMYSISREPTVNNREKHGLDAGFNCIVLSLLVFVFFAFRISNLGVTECTVQHTR